MKVPELGLTSAPLLTNKPPPYPTLPMYLPPCPAPLQVYFCAVGSPSGCLHVISKGYRYYIDAIYTVHRNVFFLPHWEVCIGTDIDLTHTLRQYSFKVPQSYICLHTCTLLLTVTCGKRLTKHTF